MGKTVDFEQKFRERARFFVAQGFRPALVFRKIQAENPEEKFTIETKKRIEAVASYYRKLKLRQTKPAVSVHLLNALVGLDKALAEAVNDNQLDVAKKIVAAKEALK